MRSTAAGATGAAMARQAVRLLRRRLAAPAGQAGEEEGLVDPALEDRDAQLHALVDDFAPLEAGLARELGGRQVIGHRTAPPVRS